jgi:hypothetical protein
MVELDDISHTPQAARRVLYQRLGSACPQGLTAGFMRQLPRRYRSIRRPFQESSSFPRRAAGRRVPRSADARAQAARGRLAEVPGTPRGRLRRGGSDLRANVFVGDEIHLGAGQRFPRHRPSSRSRRRSHRSSACYKSKRSRHGLAALWATFGRRRRRVTPDVERDALTVKGDLSKRISLSMTQPAPQASSYIPLSLGPSLWAFGLRSASAKCFLRVPRTHRKERKRSGSPPSDETASPMSNRRWSADA